MAASPYGVPPAYMILLDSLLIGSTGASCGANPCVRVCLFGGVRVPKATLSIWRRRIEAMKIAPTKQTTRPLPRPALQRTGQANTSRPASCDTVIFKASAPPPTGRGAAVNTEQRKSATSRSIKLKISIAPDTAKYLAGLTPPAKQESEVTPLLRTLYRALARCAEPGD
jgi:hypothetical protein